MLSIFYTKSHAESKFEIEKIPQLSIIEFNLFDI